MSERESMLRAAVMTYFPMFIAALSLFASVYNNHLNSKALDIIQRSLGRGEYLRTCRDIIEAYFQVKFRVGLLVQDVNHAGGIPSSAPVPKPKTRSINFPRLGPIWPIWVMSERANSTRTCHGSSRKSHAKQGKVPVLVSKSCSSKPTRCSPGSMPLA